MSDLTLDEIVSLMENTLDDAAGLDLNPVFVSGLSALIADWRKRGEALAMFACQCKVECSPGYGVPKECARWKARAALTPQQPPAKP